MVHKGLDWHGPSAQDAWDSIDALSGILETNASWQPWGYAAQNPVILLGHSNGGQGAWYLASRFPDRVLGGKRLLDVSPTELEPVDSCASGSVYQIPGIRSSYDVKVILCA